MLILKFDSEIEYQLNAVFWLMLEMHGNADSPRVSRGPLEYL